MFGSSWSCSHQASHLGRGTGLDRQHGPAIALGNHAVLQQGAVAPQQALQSLAPLTPHRQQLAAHRLKGSTGTVGHTTALFEAKMQPLLELRQGAQLGHQGRAYRPQQGIINLTAQAPSGRQGGRHLE